MVSNLLVKVIVALLCPTLRPHRLYSPWNSPGQNTGVGSCSHLQGIFPIQGSNPGLPCCRWVLYQLSHQGSPWILAWVAYPFSRGSSQPRHRTQISRIAGRFLTSWAILTEKSPAKLWQILYRTYVADPHSSTPTHDAICYAHVSLRWHPLWEVWTQWFAFCGVICIRDEK